MALPCLWLSGCKELQSADPAWTYVILSLAVVAAGAYALGRLQERLLKRPLDRPPDRPHVGDAATAEALPGQAAMVIAAMPADRPDAAERARELERQQESENFSFTVSHDLRAPIRVVEGFTRIVKEDYGRLLDRVGNDHLDRVLGAATRMNLMIDALLTLARLSQQPLARQPVDLSQLAAYVVEDLQRSAPERDAEVQIDAGLQAHGDPTLLRLVLENLLGNAWKYTQRRPRAVISLQRVALAQADRRGDQEFAYVVRDNGAGFDMRSSERLFGLFQRLHSASDFQGHGVGLASVQRIVRRHGGEVWAEAEAGRGAAFFFTLAP
ncbi:MAG: ATP-binding protein [Rubrivivax sp.]